MRWFRILNLLPKAVAVRNVSLNLKHGICQAFAQFVDEKDSAPSFKEFLEADRYPVFDRTTRAYMSLMDQISTTKPGKHPIVQFSGSVASVV